MKQKFLAALLYAAAALATANWLDYGLAEGYQYKALMEIAVAGSVAFGIAFLVALFKFRFGVIAGSLASCLAWPYFAVLLAFVPWSGLVPFVRYRYHGADQLVALACLVVVTVYLVVQRGHLRLPSGQ
jgi:hypothetical protein